MRKIIILTLVNLTVLLSAQAQDLGNTEYKKALWMSTRFYGGQRSGLNNWLVAGHLPAGVAAGLTGQSFMADADGATSLSGGWHDCGDHVKFGQTQYYAAYVLLKAYAEFKRGFDDRYSFDYAGYKSQSITAPATGWTFEGTAHDPNCIPDILDEVKHETDYMIKITPNATTFYYEVGNGNYDHTNWVTSVKMQTLAQTSGGDVRPFCNNPNDGAMASFTAATLALMSRMYQHFDPAYAAICLTHAQYAYTYASTRIGQTVGSCVGTFYGTNSNARNAWAMCLAEMYWATGTASYKTTALALTTGATSGTNQINPNNGYAFDYVNNGELALYDLAQLGHATALANFNTAVIGNQLAAGNYNTDNVYTRNGGWGVLRYPAGASFIIALYNKINLPTPATPLTLDPRVYDNIDYILGSNSGKKSFVVGFVPTTIAGANAVIYPHHRNVYLNDANPPDATKNTMVIPAKNTQFGALVGGVITSPGSYNKLVTDYQWSEVCVDYNAGLVGALGAINEVLAPVDTMKFYTPPCAVATPVTFLSLTATGTSSAIRIFWTTASEENNDYFIVYRASDASNFTPIARVDAAGNSSSVHNYSYVDRNAPSGAVYYKITQVDKDGKTSSTYIVSYDNQSKSMVSVFPNPFDVSTRLTFNGYWDAPVKVTITDLTGNVLFSLDNCVLSEPLDIGTGLPGGMYYVIVNTGEAVFTQKIVKIN
jgi:hypothetical protein